MTRLCIDVAFNVKATEIIDDGIEAGFDFEIPPAAIEEAKKLVRGMITNNNPDVDCDVQCVVYRSEVTKLNNADKA